MCYDSIIISIFETCACFFNCRNCHGIDGGLSKDEGDLPERLKVAMICDDVESCLEIAVTSWEKCVQKLKDRRLEPVKLLVMQSLPSTYKLG